MTDFKYTFEELELMIKKIDENNIFNLNTIEMQNIMTHMANDFHILHPKRELSKDNLRLYGIKSLKKSQHLILEYLFVNDVSPIIEKVYKNGFMKENTCFAHIFYEAGKKLIISFETKYHSMVCKIIEELKPETNLFNLTIIQRCDESGKVINKRYSEKFNDLEELEKKLISLSELEEVDFHEEFDRVAYQGIL